MLWQLIVGCAARWRGRLRRTQIAGAESICNIGGIEHLGDISHAGILNYLPNDCNRSNESISLPLVGGARLLATSRFSHTQSPTFALRGNVCAFLESFDDPHGSTQISGLRTLHGERFRMIRTNRKPRSMAPPARWYCFPATSHSSLRKPCTGWWIAIALPAPRPR